MSQECKFDKAWLDDVMRKVVKNLGMKFEDVRYTTIDCDPTFLSNMIFVNIIPNANDEDNEKKKTIHLVVKKQTCDVLASYLNIDEQFHNEILFYTRYAKNQEEFARCVYAEKRSKDAVIVLENVVAERGYSVPKWHGDTPMDYTYAVLRDIAKFHGKAYAMKEHRREEFFDFVKNIQQCWNSPSSEMMMVRDVCKARATDYLRSKGRSEPLLDKFHAYMENRLTEMMMKLFEPEEPLATLCHGDLTILNVLFKKVNGELTTMFIDFAMIMYASPIVDLSVFLSLHCTTYLNKNMLNDVLKFYHECLTECLKQNGVDCEKYSYEAFHEEFKKRGVFGYTVATYFLGILRRNEGEWCPAISKEMNIKECARLSCEAGGEKINILLANLLLSLKDFGCLDYFV
ncbi:unnamed protein product [Xylocopa violacea]|uniref:CHK kinase-like domain-containing protein n=1 Tax=Xylocopa violacea TaxID=135666 RepID=A0ABP1NVM9_XYLVO